ncbi:MAG: hypothetical protein MUC96_17225 [Myxococcaceae bacterium]|jgi:hypothetical protein|nr:hypothetical protein [Myxococcaceae bacterium]
MSSRVNGPPATSPAQPKKPATQPFKALLDEARTGGRTPPGLAKKAPAPTPKTAGATATSVPPKSAAEAFAAVTVAPARGSVSQAVVSAQHAATTRQLSTARAHHVATSDQLATARLSHHETQEHQTATRVIDLIVKELVSEFEPKASTKLGNPLQPVAAPDVPFPVEARATQTSTSAPSASGPTSTSATPEAKAAQAVALIERIETFVKSTRPALAMTLNNSLGARVEIEKLGPGRIALKLVGQNGPPTPETVSRIRDELRARGLEVGALSVG